MYQRGAFLPSDTIAAAGALQFYALGLLGYSVVRIASPAFYAFGESRTPVTISFVTVLANAALNFALVNVMGYRGLALGTSIAALLNAGLLLVMLRRRLGGIEGGAIAGALARIAVAAALMGAAAAGADAFLLGPASRRRSRGPAGARRHDDRRRAGRAGGVGPPAPRAAVRRRPSSLIGRRSACAGSGG